MDLWSYVDGVLSILQIRCAFLSVRAFLHAGIVMLVWSTRGNVPYAVGLH